MSNVHSIAAEARTQDSAEKTLGRLERYITSPPENSRVFTITPEMAEHLLLKNTNNRSKKPAKVAEFADQMAGDLWFLTGDTIKFSDKAELVDGQNRLHACVRSGSPFQTHVVFGIDAQAFAYMDRGKTRSPEDVLKIAGFNNTSTLAGAVRWAHLIETGRVKQRETFEPHLILRLLQERYHALPKQFNAARAIYDNGQHPTSLVMACLYHFDRANRILAAEFAAGWASNAQQRRMKPIRLMVDKVASLKAQSSGRVHDVVRAALIIKAWNLFVDGKLGTGSQMEWLPSEDFPKIRA